MKETRTIPIFITIAIVCFMLFILDYLALVNCYDPIFVVKFEKEDSLVYYGPLYKIERYSERSFKTACEDDEVKMGFWFYTWTIDIK